jgi:hypothetical protein
MGLCGLYNISDQEFCGLTDRHHEPAKFLHQPQLAVQALNEGKHKEWAGRWWQRPNAPASNQPTASQRQKKNAASEGAAAKAATLLEPRAKDMCPHTWAYGGAGMVFSHGLMSAVVWNASTQAFIKGDQPGSCAG